MMLNMDLASMDFNCLVLLTDRMAASLLGQFWNINLIMLQISKMLIYMVSPFVYVLLESKN